MTAALALPTPAPYWPDTVALALIETVARSNPNAITAREQHAQTADEWLVFAGDDMARLRRHYEYHLQLSMEDCDAGSDARYLALNAADPIHAGPVPATLRYSTPTDRMVWARMREIEAPEMGAVA